MRGRCGIRQGQAPVSTARMFHVKRGDILRVSLSPKHALSALCRLPARHRSRPVPIQGLRKTLMPPTTTHVCAALMAAAGSIQVVSGERC